MTSKIAQKPTAPASAASTTHGPSRPTRPRREPSPWPLVTVGTLRRACGWRDPPFGQRGMAERPTASGHPADARPAAPSQDAAMPEPAVLTGRRLERHFGSTVALARVDLELAPGEAVAAVGPSGSGKST